jgi:hypothetical protein
MSGEEAEALKAMGMSKADIKEIQEISRSSIGDEHLRFAEALQDLTDEEMAELTEGSNEDIVKACKDLEDKIKPRKSGNRSRAKRVADARLRVSISGGASVSFAKDFSLGGGGRRRSQYAEDQQLFRDRQRYGYGGQYGGQGRRGDWDQGGGGRGGGMEGHGGK